MSGSGASATAATVAAVALWGSVAAGCSATTASGRPPERLRGEPGWVVAQEVSLVRQRSRVDCGAAAAAMVLGRWGAAGSAEQAWRATAGDTTSNGIPAGKLRDLARSKGLQAYLIEGTMDDLHRELRLGRPVLVGLIKGRRKIASTHYEVVVGINGPLGVLLTADPDRGWREVEIEAFLSEWDPARRLAIVVFPAENQQPGEGTHG